MIKNIIKVWAVIKNTNNEILLIKEYSNKKKKYLYNIVKWTVELSDLNLNEAIKRELYEETWIKVDNISCVKWVYNKTHNNINSILVLFEKVIDNLDIKCISNHNTQDNESIIGYRFINKKNFVLTCEEDYMDLRIYNILKNEFK